MNTEMAVVVLIVLAFMWEAWTFKNKRKNDTISEITWRIAFRFPIVVFLAGVLCGHLFWQSERCREILMQAKKPVVTEGECNGGK